MWPRGYFPRKACGWNTRDHHKVQQNSASFLLALLTFLFFYQLFNNGYTLRHMSTLKRFPGHILMAVMETVENALF